MPDVGMNVDEVRRRKRFWLRAIWISIAGVIVPLLFGLAGTVFGMVGAFGELSESGEADPEAVAGDISVALLTTMWGLVISGIAFLVLIGVLIRFFTLPKPPPTSPEQSQAEQGAAPNP